MENDKKVIAIAGPTASGKTALSVMLAKRINGEIISADCMQSYQLMDIGTAKVAPCEKQGIVHYMIDEFMPNVNVNSSLFTEHALNYIDQIFSQEKTPIITGGSGLYLDSILYSSYDYADGENDEDYKKELYQLAETEGNQFIYEMLVNTDPEYAKITHPNNVKRVVRALEYYHVTGKKKSSVIKEKKYRYEHTFYFGLQLNRETLYKRINERVDAMIEKGLIEEVKMLLARGYDTKLNSMKAIGYKEIAEALSGNTDMPTAIEQVKQNSRNYAKRQFTWFNANKDIIWIDLNKYSRKDDILDFMEGMINGSK